MAKGSTQQASPPGAVPCPLLGDLRDCVQPGSPGSASLPPSSRMQRALRGDLLQEGTGRAQTWCRMESTQDQGLLVTDTQVRITSSKTRSDYLFGDRPRFSSSLRCLLSLLSGQETLHFCFCGNKLICASPASSREGSCPVRYPLSCCALAPIEF